VGDAALLVPAGDPAALRAAIGRLLGDPDERARLATESERRGRLLPGTPEAVTAVLAAYPKSDME
ncbi:MAG TPA: glycosyltransferase family 1 protein, partial [Thermopolyspora sp.]